MTELDIACLPKDLPEFIDVDLSGLDTGHSLHVSGIRLPEGVSAVVPRGTDPVVATAVVPKAAAEAEAAEGPEVPPASVAAPAAEAKAGEASKAAEKRADQKK
jgi:large subunit ribosomal protein L25